MIIRDLNTEVSKLLLFSEGWLVGNAVQSIMDGKVVNDYDIIVPNRELYHKLLFLNKSLKNCEINSYGGIKIKNNGVIIDIWCEELSHFLLNANKITYIFNYKRNILLKVEK